MDKKISKKKNPVKKSKKKTAKKTTAKSKSSEKIEVSKESVKTLSNSELKRDRFLRIVPKRVNKIIDEIRKLSNCSDTSNYTYMNEEIEKVFSTIRKSLKEAEIKFSSGKKAENEMFSF